MAVRLTAATMVVGVERCVSDGESVSIDLDDMDSCRVHGIDSMRYTPPKGDFGRVWTTSARNLDHWACSQCGFKPSEIDWVAEIRKEKG